MASFPLTRTLLDVRPSQRFQRPVWATFWATVSAAVLGAVLALGATACRTATVRGTADGEDLATERFEFERAAMGTTFRIVLYAEDGERARRAAEAAFDRIQELDRTLSDWQPDSELSRLCAQSDAGPSGPIPVSEDLFAVLAHAARTARQTGGAFDVSVGPWVRLWRRSVRQGELPTPEALAAARKSVGYEWVVLDPDSRTVTLALPRMRLDLGGIAKGFALDQALAVLAERGVPRALVDGGGDVAVGAPPPGRRAWRVAVATTRHELERAKTYFDLVHAAVATSGDLFQSVEIGGRRYSHIIDPVTGLGLTRRVSATVVARTGIQADALASALCVLGSQRGLALVEATVGVEARVIEEEKEAAGACDSSGLDRMMGRRSAAPPRRRWPDPPSWWNP